MEKGIDSAQRLSNRAIDLCKKDGIQYIARYIGSAENWKTLKQDELEVILSNKLKLLSIWETNPTYPSYFSFDKGKQDAENATQYAQELGQSSGTAIYFAVDFSAERADLPSIVDYFTGIREGIDAKFFPGAYGSYDVIRTLQAHKSVTYFWQTYAWSNNKVCKGIHLYQHKNEVAFSDIKVDYNNVFKAPGAWDVSNRQETKQNIKKSPNIYKVKRGDYLGEIAAKYNIPLAKLIEWNDIKNPNLITTGQIIQLKKPEDNFYTVEKGDTLSSISKKSNVSLNQIIQLNNIKNENLIFPGEKIRIR